MTFSTKRPNYRYDFVAFTWRFNPIKRPCAYSGTQNTHLLSGYPTYNSVSARFESGNWTLLQLYGTIYSLS